MIHAQCTACLESYRLRTALAGKVVKCRKCGNGFRVGATVSEPFKSFLSRAPKPKKSPLVTREPGHKRPQPVASDSGVEVAAASRMKLVTLGVSGLAVMAFTSVMTFLIANAALADGTEAAPPVAAHAP